jgi:hypothetical protein
MPPGGGGGGDEPRSGLREVAEEAAAEVTVFEDAAGSVIALTAAAPSSNAVPRISMAVPFVMPVCTATPRMPVPS